MPGIPQPGNNLIAEWDLGESGYKPQMDKNLRFLSGAVQLVLTRSDGEVPEFPEQGMLIATTGRIEGYHEGEWVEVGKPKIGWFAFDMFLGAYVEFTSGGWKPVTWIHEAPDDGRRYVRKDGDWLPDDYHINAFIPQIPAANYQLAAFIIPVPMVLPVSAEGCVARATTAPPDEVVLSLRSNDVPIGTITFAADAQVGTIDLFGTEDIELAEHSELSIQSPLSLAGVPEGIKILFRLEM